MDREENIRSRNSLKYRVAVLPAARRLWEDSSLEVDIREMQARNKCRVLGTKELGTWADLALHHLFHIKPRLSNEKKGHLLLVGGRLFDLDASSPECLMVASRILGLKYCSIRARMNVLQFKLRKRYNYSNWEL